MMQKKLCQYGITTVCARTKSTNFRYVESKPPIVNNRYKIHKAKVNMPSVGVFVDNKEGINNTAVGENHRPAEVNEILPDTQIGSFVYYKEGLFECVRDAVAHSSYTNLCDVLKVGFVQHREHIRDILNNTSQHNRFVISGDRWTGKTLTLYALLHQAVTLPDQGVIVPALHLARWFQDTSNTQTQELPNGHIDYPAINAEFLKYLVDYNTHPANPDRDMFSGIVLQDDERWTSQIYSFKGDSILNVARIGLENPLIAHHTISTILHTLLEQNVTSKVLVDNANLLCAIHSSMLEEHRDTGEWWNQPVLLPDNITLLSALKQYIKEHVDGKVFLTIDPRNNIAQQVKSETGSDYVDIQIPSTPSDTEYLAYLNVLREHGVISRDMSSAEAYELMYLTGRSYIDTYKMSFLI